MPRMRLQYMFWCISVCPSWEEKLSIWYKWMIRMTADYILHVLSAGKGSVDQCQMKIYIHIQQLNGG